LIYNLIVILLSFGMLRYLVVRETRNSLLQTQISEYRSSIEQYAVEAASFLRTADGDGLFTAVDQWSDEIGGRILVSDSAGVIQADAFSAYNGIQLPLTDLAEVLKGTESFSYSYYWLSPETKRSALLKPEIFEKIRLWLSTDAMNRQLVVYMVTPIVSGSRISGAVIASVSVQDVMDRISLLEFQTTLLMLVAALGMLTASIMIASSVVKPLGDMSRGLQRIGAGDFVHRIPVRGRSELAQIGNEINIMTEKLAVQDQVRREFISDASHELKTPLSTVKLLVQSMLQSPVMDEEMSREFLQDIDSEVDRMSALVGDLLDLVKSEGAQRVVNPEQVDVSELCRSVIDRLTPSAQKKKQRLTGDITPDLQLWGDASMLERMILNLTDNAIKYTPAEGHVQVSLAKRGRNLLLTVKDDGIGIGEEEQKHIFERFYRVDKARSRQTGGTGLGLSIVKEIASIHHGSIQVTSQLGKGTTMTVTLPETGERGENP